jgi:hypothetical protein
VIVALAVGLFEAFRDSDEEPRVVLAGDVTPAVPAAASAPEAAAEPRHEAQGPAA